MYGSVHEEESTDDECLVERMQQQQQQVVSKAGLDPTEEMVTVSLNNVSAKHILQNGIGSATQVSCVINIANTIVGAGMLGLPGAFAGTGYAGGILLMVLGALFSGNGLVLLSKAAQATGFFPSSFYTVATASVPRYTILVDLAVSLKCFGVATGYLITVADCMVDAFAHILQDNDKKDYDLDEVDTMRVVLLSRHFWVVCAILTVLPVSFYRTLDDLKRTSALALFFVFFLVLGIVAYAFGIADPCYSDVVTESRTSCRGEVVAFNDIPSTISKLPIFIFAFTCHQNIFPVVNEIQNRTQRRINTVIIVSLLSTFVVFIVVALCGYFTYGANIRGDILLSYPKTQNVTILRMCIAFMLVLHYPLQLDPSRRCIMTLVGEISVVARSLMTRLTRGNNGANCQIRKEKIDSKIKPSTCHSYDAISAVVEDITTEEDDDNNKSKSHAEADTGTEKEILMSGGQDQTKPDNASDDNSFLFNTITICFLSSSFTLAMIVDDLGVVLAMVGATGSTLVSYVLPGLIYIKLSSFDSPLATGGDGGSGNEFISRVLAFVQLFLGLLIIPLALYFVLFGG